MQIIRFLLALAVGLTLAMVPSTSQAATPFTFDVATANIWNKLSATDAEEDIDRVIATSSVVGFQEFKFADRYEALDKYANWDYVGYHGDGRYQPIAWDATKWNLINWGSESINSNQNRYLTWVVLERTGAPSDPGYGQRIRFVNTHFTSGGSWDKAYADLTQAEKDARVQWNECWASLNNKIDTWMADGTYYPIVGVGDFNRKRDDIALFATNQEHYSVYNKIDHVFVIPKGRFENKGNDTPDDPNNPWNTDHGPYVAKVRFTG